MIWGTCGDHVGHLRIENNKPEVIRIITSHWSHKYEGEKGKVSGEHLGNRWVILDMWVTSNQRSNNNKICIIAPRKKRSTTRFPEKYHTVCNSLTIQRNITLSVCSYLIDGVNFEAGVMLKSFCNKSGALAITFIKSESK